MKSNGHPGFKADHISQIPALQMLVNLGYTYLSQAEADRQRGGKTTNVLPEEHLRSGIGAKCIGNKKRSPSNTLTVKTSATLHFI